MSDPWTEKNRLYGQNYKKLLKSHLKSGTLFEDPHFPANSSSLSLDGEVDGDSARSCCGKAMVSKMSTSQQGGD